MAEFFRRDLPEPGYDTTDFSRIQGLRGVVLNPDALSGGNVQLDARGVLALGDGAARLGQGVASVGSDMMALAEEQMRAIAIHQETDAENAMSDAEGKIQVAITEQPDETKWRGLADKHIAGFEQSLSGREMTASARDAIRQKVAGWKNRVGHFVGMASARRSVERAREGIAGKAERMRAAGDFGGLSALLTQPGTTHFMGDDWIAGQEVAAVREAKEAAWENEYRVIQETPDLEQYQKDNSAVREGETPGEHSRRMNAMQNALVDRVHGAVADVANEIASNPDATEATLAEKAGGRLNAAEMERWTNELAKRRNLKEQFKRAQPAAIHAAFARLLDEADGFDRSKPNARAEYGRLHLEAEGLLPVGMRGEVTGIIERKWRASNEPPDPPDEMVQTVRDTATRMFEDGELGQYKTTEKRTKDGKEVEVEVRNGAEQDKARAKQGALQSYMLRQWLPANPGKTPEDALKVMHDWTRGEAPTIRFTKPQAMNPAPQTLEQAAFSQAPTDEGLAITLDGPLPSKTNSEPPSNMLIPTTLGYDPETAR